jgi:Peptidase_C39 like family
MTNHRHLRKRFRHARRHPARQRLGRVPLVSAAAIGVAVVGAVPASQAMSAATVVDLSAAQSQTAAGSRATANPAPAATTPAAAKSSPGVASTSPGVASTSPGVASTSPAANKPTATRTAEPAAPAKLQLQYKYAVQINGWYCGPAAARIALTARGLYPSQDELAARLGTTVNGTNSSADVARVLNAMTKTSLYRATSIPTKSVTTTQVNQLRSDVVDAVRHGYAVVMNVVGTAQDTAGTAYSFPGGHYIAAVGYQDNGRQVKIADPANGYRASYWVTVSDLATWAGTRGYAA